MTLDQIILLITAGISLLAVFVTYLSVRKMGKQVEIQKSQWEYSQKPIFKIIKSQQYHVGRAFIIENSNNIYHIIESITFSLPVDVEVYDIRKGFLQNKSEKDDSISEYHGLIVILKSKTDSFVEGVLQIRGKDVLGNSFVCNSPSIKFENKKVINSQDYFEIYFKNI